MGWSEKVLIGRFYEAFWANKGKWTVLLKETQKVLGSIIFILLTIVLTFHTISPFALAATVVASYSPIIYIDNSTYCQSMGGNCPYVECHYSFWGEFWYYPTFVSSKYSQRKAHFFLLLSPTDNQRVSGYSLKIDLRVNYRGIAYSTGSALAAREGSCPTDVPAFAEVSKTETESLTSTFSEITYDQYYSLCTSDGSTQCFEDIFSKYGLIELDLSGGGIAVATSVWNATIWDRFGPGGQWYLSSKEVSGIELSGCRDTDGDGVNTCAGDCNDDDPAIYPGAAEGCDGRDNNCDGQVDEGCCEVNLGA